RTSGTTSTTANTSPTPTSTPAATATSPPAAADPSGPGGSPPRPRSHNRHVSDENGTPAAPAGSTGPRPEPIRFFGTTWVNHDKGYALRRIGAATGSLAAAVAACLVLDFAYQGLQIA